jgi:hypothetical protein
MTMKRLIAILTSVMLTGSLAIGAGNFVPPSDGGADLGTSSLEWNAIYVKSVVSTNVGGTNAAMQAKTLTVGEAATVGTTLGVAGEITAGTTVTMATNVTFYTGILTNRAALVTSTATSNSPIGSVYFSNGGLLFVRVSQGDPDVTNDWSVVDMDNADTPTP